jgi:multidrug efflux pump
VIASTAEPQQLLEVANTLVGKAFASGLFMFADADLKFDQPQAEVVFNRDKCARRASTSARRARPLDAAGRRLRQPLQHPGPQLQGDPQVKREGASRRSSSPRST